MNRNQEICRDFQRGNCRFGARCKYLHVTAQQQRSQQPKNDFGGGGNFYNANNSNHKQSQYQSQAAGKEHRCNDPRVCKDQIKEDFANEQPLFWRLTCYAHYRFLPNDIVGDISPEELRALAYEGAKQGLSLKDVAQREASMMAAKQAEFDALRRNPYNGPAIQSAFGIQNSPTSPFSSSQFLSPPQKNTIPNPFGQLAAVPSASPPQMFGQNPFGGTPSNSFGQIPFGGSPSNTFEHTPFGGTPTNSFGQSPFRGTQSNMFEQTTFGGTPTNPLGFGQPRGGFQSTNQFNMLSSNISTPFGYKSNGSQGSPLWGNTSPSPGSAPQSGSTMIGGFSQSLNTNGYQSASADPFGAVTSANSSFSPLGFSAVNGSPVNLSASQGVNPSSNSQAPMSQTAPSTFGTPGASTDNQDVSIWLKPVWKIGEIPEGEPPPEVRM